MILVGPSAPPVRGMTVEAGLLATRLLLEGAKIRRVASDDASRNPLADVPVVGAAFPPSKFVAALREAIADGADVVHVQSEAGPRFDDVTCAALREARDADVRTVVRWHGAVSEEFLASTPERIAAAMRAADEVVVASTYMRDVFRERLGVESRVVPPIVDEPGTDRPPARGGGQLRLLSARRLVPEHGVRLALDAAARAASSGVDLRIVVAGDGPERAELERLAARALPNRATFLGAVARDRVLDELRACDVVVNGSSSDDFPMAIAEALASGVPVATTDAGGIATVVEHDSTGLVTRCGDADALAASIARFDADRAELLGFGWRAKVGALRWTWDVLRASWAAAYGRRTLG
jgi:phenylacetate-CoA ligase